MVAGPVLLEDYHLIEKLAQFDRERIPERVVHARGATAKGFFEVRNIIAVATKQLTAKLYDLCRHHLALYQCSYAALADIAYDCLYAHQ